MPRIPFPELHATLTAAMTHLGLATARAQISARLVAEATRDGVYTHGLNRFPRFVATVRNGSVDLAAEPSLITAFGALERWSGNQGVGNLNALASIDRAAALARRHGIGCVALAHTNHWMRGGTYGWHAADQGLFALCWTNTGRNLPAWGTAAASLGNNPLVLAIPRSCVDGSYRGGPHVVLDMAMSQFSYGQLEAYARRGEPLPIPGGFDAEGNLTHDPAAILQSFRALPIGFWKGSGLALTLDLFAALLSGGQATHQISPDPLFETGLSQLFLVIDPARLASPAELDRAASALIEELHHAPRSDPGKSPLYPGENTLNLRENNLLLGVPVEEHVWRQVLDLARGA